MARLAAIPRSAAPAPMAIARGARATDASRRGAHDIHAASRGGPSASITPGTSPVPAAGIGEDPQRPRAVPGPWLAIYIVAIVGPFGLIGLSHPGPSRTFTHELGSSLGIVVLVLLAMQLVLPARLRLFAPLGADVAVRLHRRLATVVLTLTAAHVLVIILADPARLALLRFVDAPLRAQAGIAAVAACCCWS